MSKHNFYKIENNVVTDGKVVSSNDCFTNGTYDESKGATFISNLAGGGTWVGSPNDVNTYSGHACVGATFENNFFKCPSPHASFVWNNDTQEWENPVANPEPNNDMVSFNYNTGVWTKVVITGDPGTIYNENWTDGAWVKDDASEQAYDSSTLPPNPYA